jgi:hypothetical protein
VVKKCDKAGAGVVIDEDKEVGERTTSSNRSRPPKIKMD